MALSSKPLAGRLEEDLTLEAALAEDELVTRADDGKCNDKALKESADALQAHPVLTPVEESAKFMDDTPTSGIAECFSLFQDCFLFGLAIASLYLWRYCKAWAFAGTEPDEVKTRTPENKIGQGTGKAVQTSLDVDEVVKAMYSDNKDDLRKLMSERAVNARDEMCCCTALHIAAHYSCKPAAEALLARGANANVQDIWDETPLHFAARAGHVEVCTLLLQNGADANATNASGWTPLLVAAEAQKEETCDLLLDHGAHTAGADEEELPPLLCRLLQQRILRGA
jgi:hypothetical protein